MQYVMRLIVFVLTFTGLMPCAMMAAEEIVQQSIRAYGMEATIPEEVALELIGRYQRGDDYMSLVDTNIDKSKLIATLSVIKKEGVSIRFTTGGNRQYQYINGKYPKLSDSQRLIGFSISKVGVQNPDRGPGYFIVEKDVNTGVFIIVDFDCRSKIDDEKRWENISAEPISLNPVNPEKPFTVCNVLENLDAYSGKIIQIRGLLGYGIEDKCETQLQVAGRKWPNNIYIVGTDSLDMWDNPANWRFDTHDLDSAWKKASQESTQFNDDVSATIIGRLETRWAVFQEGPSLLGYLNYFPARIIVKEIKDIEGPRIPLKEYVPIINLSIE